MFDHREYVPILKWKRGEQTALKELTNICKLGITPLIEVQPIPYDHEKDEFKKTIDKHLDKIGEQVKSSWGVEKPIFVDVFTLYDNEDFDSDTLLSSGQHPVEFVIDSIENHGTAAIPVTGLFRYQSFHDAIKKVIQKYNRGVCIRLESDELNDLAALKNDLDDLLDFLNLSPDDADLVLDHKQISNKQKNTLIHNKILILAQLPYLKQWRTLTICSTAFPKNLTLHVPSNSQGALPRTEWTIYKHLANLNLARVPSFGDYNINNPAFVNLNPKLINPAVSIKYSRDDEFLIFKGAGIKNNGLAGMPNLAKQLVAHPKYCGQAFSFGDQYIFDCANGGPTGNLETWVTVGVNHHLTLVVNDLANLYGP